MTRTPWNTSSVVCPGLVILRVWGCVILCGAATAATDFLLSTSSLDSGSSSCNLTTLSTTRSTWRSEGELCSQKLPFAFWTYMKAEGTAEDPDAKHVLEECLMPSEVGSVELMTPEDWDTTIMEAAPGELLRETKRAAFYLIRSPVDFEAMCADDQVTKVSRVDALVETGSIPSRKSARRLQSTVSKAGTAHGVDTLIAGLEELGCQRTTGEDQTLCILSDSFNRLGGKASLQESGDLPPDEFLTIVEELPVDEERTPIDEGSAMMELAYDIAKGPMFKFNTMAVGSVAAADDIRKLGAGEADGGEACDVIVDDITYIGDPLFRDGNISQAVDEVVAAGSIYFASAGNYGNGYKFTANWECTFDIYGADFTDEPCEGGAHASHVFDPEATGLGRYFLELGGGSRSGRLYLHWDDDEGTSRSVILQILIVTVNSVGSSSINDVVNLSDFGRAFVVIDLSLFNGFEDNTFYFLSITQDYSDLEGVEMRLISTDDEVFRNFPDGSVSGHKCGTSTISVAAFNLWDISTVDGVFPDPEEGSVADFSSRGPCYVDSGSGLETRLKPVTTAVSGLRTSTNPDAFDVFNGTSAAAPVAAAIATIIRAACFPRVVLYADMMEMLTNYDYTVDFTSDAGGEAETWGSEAGYGIISAEQMLGWVAANCPESCPGNATTSTPVPTPVLSTGRPTNSPTTSPTSTPSAQTTFFTASPTSQFTAPSTPTTNELPPTSSPVIGFLTAFPISPPTELPAERPTLVTELPITRTVSPTETPSISPTSREMSPMESFVDASERTNVTVTANAYDTRTSGFGCAPDGCVAGNTRDGDIYTRWSCKEDLLDDNCKIMFIFEEPQDIVRILIAFYKGDERTRKLKVILNGSSRYVIESTGKTAELEDFELNTGETTTLTLEGLGLSGDEWISISEVQFMVL